MILKLPAIVKVLKNMEDNEFISFYNSYCEDLPNAHKFYSVSEFGKVFSEFSLEEMDRLIQNTKGLGIMGKNDKYFTVELLENGYPRLYPLSSYQESIYWEMADYLLEKKEKTGINAIDGFLFFDEIKKEKE